MGCSSDKSIETNSSISSTENNPSIEKEEQKEQEEQKSIKDPSENNGCINEEKIEYYNFANVKGENKKQMLKKETEDHYFKNDVALPGGLEGLCEINEKTSRLANNQNMKREEHNGNKKENLQSMNRYEEFEKNIHGNNLINKYGNKGYYNKDESGKQYQTYQQKEKNEKVGNTVHNEKVETSQKMTENYCKEQYNINKDYVGAYYSNVNNNNKSNLVNNISNNDVVSQVKISNYGKGDDFEKIEKEAIENFEAKRKQNNSLFGNNRYRVVSETIETYSKVKEDQINIINEKKKI